MSVVNQLTRIWTFLIFKHRQWKFLYSARYWSEVDVFIIKHAMHDPGLNVSIVPRCCCYCRCTFNRFKEYRKRRARSLMRLASGLTRHWQGVCFYEFITCLYSQLDGFTWKAEVTDVSFSVRCCLRHFCKFFASVIFIMHGLNAQSLRFLDSECRRKNGV